MRDGGRDGERDGGGGVPEVRWRVIGCGRWLGAKGVAQCKAGGNGVGVIAVSFIRSGSACTPTQNVRGGVPRAVPGELHGTVETCLGSPFVLAYTHPSHLSYPASSCPILSHPVLSCSRSPTTGRSCLLCLSGFKRLYLVLYIISPNLEPHQFLPPARPLTSPDTVSIGTSPPAPRRRPDHSVSES